MMPRPTIYYNDNDPTVCAWIRQLMFDGLIPYGVVDSRSILDVQPADLDGFTQCHFFCGIAGWAYALKLAGWPSTRPVWTGSPPCQPFSAAGKLEGKDDARHLAPKFISLVGACRPDVLFGEQVASSAVFGTSAKRTGGEPEWAWLDDLFHRLEAAHYAVGASDIPAAGVGAPHIRQRTFFGAVRLDHTRSVTEGQRTEAEARDETRLRGPERGCGHERLAESHCGQRNGLANGQGRINDRAATGWQQGDGEPERGGGGERLADHDKPGWQGMPQRPVECAAWPGGVAERQRQQPQDSGAVRLAYAGGRGSAPGIPEQIERQEGQSGKHDDNGNQCAGRQAPPATARPGTDHGGWDNVDWLFCRDGKWRPVKSSVQCVADGLSGGVVQSGDFVSASYPLAQASRRVMRLRGYGNAIVPQAAALFIRAFEVAAR